MTLQQVRLAMTGLALCLSASQAAAAPLTLDNVTAPEAAARLSDKFGVEVSLQGHFNHYLTVSFAVEDADAPAGRLQAINALANALGADFNKEFLIQKASDSSSAAPKIDTTASMPFPQKTYSAKEAIAMVAGLDDATAQRTEDADGTLFVVMGTGGVDALVPPSNAVNVNGNVTFSSPTLTVAQAAAEIAAQTHTHWQTIYVLTPRIPARARGGTVIGRTDGGSAIVELASVYYHDAKWQARQQQIAQAQQAAEAAQQAADQQAASDQQAAYQQAIQQGTYGAANPVYNASGYNNSPYGSSYGGNGYGMYGNGYGSNYGGYYGYGNAPIVFGPGNY